MTHSADTVGMDKCYVLWDDYTPGDEHSCHEPENHDGAHRCHCGAELDNERQSDGQDA